MNIFIRGALALVVAAMVCTGVTHAQSAADSRKPNILLILVDDMGYGDPQCFNPKSRLKTPAIDLSLPKIPSALTKHTLT